MVAWGSLSCAYPLGKRRPCWIPLAKVAEDSDDNYTVGQIGWPGLVSVKIG